MYDDINKDVNHTDFQDEKSVKWLFGNIITLKKMVAMVTIFIMKKKKNTNNILECRGNPIMLLLFELLHYATTAHISHSS